MQCAVAIQHELKTRNAELPPHRRMEFRIGINLGDVIVEGERLYGDGVNIAARVESLALPGNICISGSERFPWFPIFRFPTRTWLVFIVGYDERRKLGPRRQRSCDSILVSRWKV